MDTIFGIFYLISALPDYPVQLETQRKGLVCMWLCEGKAISTQLMSKGEMAMA